MGYPRVRIAPIVGWSGGLGVSVFMEPLMERCSSVVHLSGVRRSVSSLVLFSWQDLGSSAEVQPVNRLETYSHRCRPIQAPCGL